MSMNSWTGSGLWLRAILIKQSGLTQARLLLPRVSVHCQSTQLALCWAVEKAGAPWTNISVYFSYTLSLWVRFFLDFGLFTSWTTVAAAFDRDIQSEKQHHTKKICNRHTVKQMIKIHIKCIYCTLNHSCCTPLFKWKLHTKRPSWLHPLGF